MKFVMIARTEEYKLLRILTDWSDSNTASIDPRVNYQYRKGGIQIVARGLDSATKADLEYLLRHHGVAFSTLPEGKLSLFVALFQLSLSFKFGVAIVGVFWIFTLASTLANVFLKSNIGNSIIGFLLLNACIFGFIFITNQLPPLISLTEK